MRMATVGKSSSSPSVPDEEKPVIVLVKRKASLSLVEALWLEIKQRPIKRPLLDFENLSISESSGIEELKTKKVFVQHVETLKSIDALEEVVQSFMGTDSVDIKTRIEARSGIFKRENQIQELLLVKARQDQELTGKLQKYIREVMFVYIKDNAAATNDKLHEICHFYDVIRVDAEERPKQVRRQEEMSFDDQMMLSSYMPLLRDQIPAAAKEIKADIRASVSHQGSLITSRIIFRFGQEVSEEVYVYDFYVVKHNVEKTGQHTLHPYPLVRVDDADYYNYSDESEYEPDDSNGKYTLPA